MMGQIEVYFMPGFKFWEEGSVWIVAASTGQKDQFKELREVLEFIME